ncbi:MAG: hypothetical protein WD492_07585 [Alkalispirochaeta sp.]
MSTPMETRMADVERWLQKTAYAQFEFQMKMDAYHEEMRAQNEARRRELQEQEEQRQREKVEQEEQRQRELRESEATSRRGLEEFKEENRRIIRGMNQRWGEIANKMGTIVEDIVAPNIPRILREYFGVEDLAMLAQCVRRRHPEDRSRRREFDVIAVSDDSVFVNETKSTLRTQDIERFAHNYREVIEFFPEYADYAVVPIMSSLNISAEHLSALTTHGVYAMGMGDRTMDLLNVEAIRARSN